MTRAAVSQLEAMGWQSGLLHMPLPWNEPYAGEMQRWYSSKSVYCASMLRPSGFDDLLDKALAQTDPAKSAEFAQQAATMIHNEALVIPCWNTPSLLFIGNNVHDTGYLRQVYASLD
jgi:ABC-type transport system substrate-binding protein